MPRMTALHMLRSTISTVSAPASSSFRGSLPHPTHPLCTLRVRRHRRLTQHSLPGGSLGLTWAGLATADRASFAWSLPSIDHLVGALLEVRGHSALAVLRLSVNTYLVGACLQERTSTPQVLSSLGCGSRHIMAGASAASAWSCRRTGSRSPSVARCRMQRASSLARTFSMPLHLSVNQASSNAASRIASVLGSNDPLPSPRMFPLSDRILLEAGPPEHHHDVATLWSLPAMNCTRAMHGERSIAAVSAEALLGPYVCSLRSSASPRLPPSCLSPPSLLRRIVCSQAPLARCGNSGGPHRNLCAHLLQHVTLCCKPVLLRLAIQPSAGIP
jgi:hypothetical protein